MWSLECFGGLRAVREPDNGQNSQTIERFRTHKTAGLLALLALQGSQSRERACALLWPDATPEAARNSLSAALSALRRELGEGILNADRQTVALVPCTVSTDVEHFDAALKTQDYAVAVALYKGSLLPGFHEDPFPALAAEYEEKARQAFRTRLEELETTRDATATLALARRAISLFGKEEYWFLAQMRAYQQSGDVEAALRVYEALQRWTRKHSDAASETARQLAKALRREREQQKSLALPMSNTAPGALSFNSAVPAGESASSSQSAESTSVDVLQPTDTGLPPQWTRFFGREAERELLRSWLQHEKLITLSGAGGSGKTRLVIETAREMLAVGSITRLYFVSLASLQDANLLHATIRDAMHLRIASDLSPLEQIEHALRDQPCLLLLDNFEQLLPPGSAQLQILRERVPQATFLVTSRVLLRLPGERELPLSPLPTPLRHTGPDEVRECPSAALFCDRSGIEVRESNAEAIGALCRRLDGIPLALELAAARARVLSPAQILERLERHPDFLTSRELGIPPRHKTLRATIEWSTDLLSPELRRFFLHLSVFRGGWTIESAEAICEETDVLESLTHLRESSLVRVLDGEGEPRFRMLETLREFGQEHLEAADKEQLEHSFFDYFLHLAQQAAREMQGPQQTEWLHRFDIEQDNIRAALSWAREHDPTRGLLLATALIDFWETRLSLAEGTHWLETFLNATSLNGIIRQSANGTSNGTSQHPRPTLAERSRALTGAGRLAWYASDLKGANLLLEEALETARQAGDPSAFIYATRSLARLTAVAGDGERAYQLGREGVRLSREAGDKVLLLESLLDLSLADLNASDFPAARATCREAVALSREVGDEQSLALALINLAIAEHYEGHNDAARPSIVESEALCRRLGAQWELMVCLSLLGRVVGQQGDYATAQVAFEEALEICRATSVAGWNIVNVLNSVSYGFFQRGDTAGAVHLMGAADALGESIGYRLMSVLVPENEHYRAAAREVLGQSKFEAAWKRGRLMASDEAIDFAIEAGRNYLAQRNPAMALL